MAYVPSCEHDIFVSYAHVDNAPLAGAERGWVSTLIDELKKELARLLGRADAFSLWMDHELRGNEPVTPDIDDQLKKSATFVFIVSEGYLASHWCRLEFHTFLDQVGEGSGRLFMIEPEGLKPEQKLPEFEELIGYQFWKSDPNTGRARILGIPKPNPDRHPEYYENLTDLAAQLADKLKQLREEELVKEDEGIKLSRLKAAKKSRLESEKISLEAKIKGSYKQHDSISKAIQLRIPDANRQNLKKQLEKLETAIEESEDAVEQINDELEKLTAKRLKL